MELKIYLTSAYHSGLVVLGWECVESTTSRWNLRLVELVNGEIFAGCCFLRFGRDVGEFQPRHGFCLFRAQ